MFEIPNTPRAAPARNRSRRAAVDKKSKSRGGMCSRDKNRRRNALVNPVAFFHFPPRSVFAEDPGRQENEKGAGREGPHSQFSTIAQRGDAIAQSCHRSRLCLDGAHEETLHEKMIPKRTRLRAAFVSFLLLLIEGNCK